MGRTQDTWPAGATWVFRGTVAEDATAGTHVTSLTVTPGAGNEIALLYGIIIVGATVTAQTAFAKIDDGTNTIAELLATPAGVTSGIAYGIPVGNQLDVTAHTVDTPAVAGVPLPISGTMRLVLQVTTTAVSVTQTFGTACRLKTSALPTATLADTVGAPVNTTSTNKVF